MPKSITPEMFSLILLPRCNAASQTGTGIPFTLIMGIISDELPKTYKLLLLPLKIISYSAA